MTVTAPRLPESLTAAIHAAEAVTFDIFDTALVRAVENPVDLFLLLAHEAHCPDPHAWAQARIASERLARQRAWEQRQAAEVSLPEIYACLAECPEAITLDLAALMAQERKLELRVCQRQPLVGQAYELARRLGKRVGFISDMYLDAPLIAAMLDKCGYRDYEFLHVSSAVGKTKAHGDLYPFVHARHGLDPARQLHIGDNLHSDIQQARAAGIKTHPVNKNAELLPATPVGQRFERLDIAPVRLDSPAEGAIWTSLWRGLAAARQPHGNDDFWYELGYTHVGLLLLGFLLWIDRTARDGQVTHLYFLARDGHVMHRVHALLAARGLTGCAGSYLYASRRALNVPALTAVDEPACDFLVSGTSRLTVGEFLARLGLSVTEALPLIEAAGFTGPGQGVRSGRDYGRLRALFRALEPALVRLAAQERERLGEYWRQEGVFEQAHIGLVDIGWHGSLQDSFTRLLGLLGKEAKVSGFYLGTFAPAKARVAAGARQFAYLCAGGEPARRLAVIRASVEIFEWLFCAPHGSVLGFQRTASGAMAPVLEASALEAVREATASRMQEGALQFIEDALACFAPGYPLPPVPSGLEVALLDDLLRRPTAEEAVLLGNLPHAEGFGGVTAVRPIARPAARLYQLRAWPRLIKGYRQAFWRKGYLRRLWPDCW